MKQVIIKSSAAIALGVSLVAGMWLLLTPHVEAETLPPPLTQAALSETIFEATADPPPSLDPLAIPLRQAPLTIPVDINEPFAVNPLTQSVTVDFDTVDDLDLFTGVEHDNRHPGSVSIVDYDGSDDGDTELSLSHKAGIVNNTNDMHYAYYLNTPITDVIQVEVQLLKTHEGLNARAGIELRNIGPVAAVSDDTSRKIYLFISKTFDDNYRLGAGWRIGSGSAEGQRDEELPDTGDTDAGFRVHEGPDYQPIWLRIVRDDDTYSFYYRDEKGTNVWEPMYIVQGDSGTELRTFTKSIGDPLYVSLFGSTTNGQGAAGATDFTYFDNLSYVYSQTLQLEFPEWETTVYGADTALAATPNTNRFGYLELSSDGTSVTQANDNSAGYSLFHRRELVQTDGNLDVIVQLESAPTISGGIGGLELRTEPTINNSAKLGLGLQRAGNDYRLVAFSRMTNTAAVILTDTATISTTDGPVWLRVTRATNSDTFTFYYAQQAGDTEPSDSEWIQYTQADIAISNALYAGLFNASGQDNQAETTEFDNFRLEAAEFADDPIIGLTVIGTPDSVILNNPIDFSTSVISGTGIDYQWDLGNGETATGSEVPNYVYDSTGIYTVVITASNNISENITASTVVSVTEIPISGLVATNTTELEIPPPRPDDGFVTLSASVSAGTNVTYEWNLGDGSDTVATQLVEDYRYIIFSEDIVAGNDSFTAIVTATNSAGSVSASTQVVFEDIALTGVRINKTPITDTFIGVATELAAILESPGVSNNVWYAWDFGPNATSPSEQFLTGDRNTNRIVNPIYDTPGIYTVRLIVTNSTNMIEELVEVTVVDIPDVPITTLEASSDGPTVIGNPTTLQATVNPDSTNVIYQWDFGDGSDFITTTNPTISHTYGIGLYTATVVASNNQGFLNDETSFIIYGEPNLDISKTAPSLVEVGERFTYTLQISNTGADAAFDVTISDIVPNDLTVLAVGGDLETSTELSNTVTWSLDTFYITETYTLEIGVISNDSAVVQNNQYSMQGINRLGQNRVAIGSENVTTDIAFPPVANAGPTQEVPPGAIVMLDGSGSSDPDNKALTYLWEQLGGANVTLDDPTDPQPTFIAPTELGELLFRLTVTNSSGLSDSRQTQINVSYEPIFIITKSGPQEVNYGDLITYTITLSNIGTAPGSQIEVVDDLPAGTNYVSSAGGFNGGLLENGSVTWKLNGVEIGEFVTLTLVITSDLGVQTVVNDDYAVSSIEGALTVGDDVVVTVVKQNPLANAGPNQVMLRNTPVQLDGRKTTDPQNESLTYQWTQISGAEITFDDPTALRPTFVSPNTLGDVVLQLLVTNESNLTDTDEVRITIARWTAVVGTSGAAVPISCSDSEATVAAQEGVTVRNPNSTIYIGYNRDVTSSRDPLVVRFTDGTQSWCRTDYETTSEDNVGYGLLWDGSNRLYGVFNAFRSGEGDDFRRFSGWLTRYNDGSGGSAGREVAVLAKIFPNDGDISPTAEDSDGQATFITGLDGLERVNRVIVNDLSFVVNGNSLGDVVVEATADRVPRQADKNGFFCAGDGPFDYTLLLAQDLQSATDATAVGCQFVYTPPTTTTIDGPTTGFPNRNYLFRSTTLPADATTPLTVTWSPTPQSGQSTSEVTYRFAEVGLYTLTVQVYNEGGITTGTQTVLIKQDQADIISPTAVSINGPIRGEVSLPYTFTAHVSPTDVSPVLYSWSPTPQTGQGTDTAQYQWDTLGLQAITLTVQNVAATLSTTKSIEIVREIPPMTAPMTVTIQGAVTAVVSSTVAYTGTVLPVDAVTPLTLTWSPQPNSGQGSGLVSYQWVTTGTKYISLTVSNPFGSASGVYTVEVVALPMTTPLNLTPTAVADVVTTSIATARSIAVLTNDSDPDGDSLTLVSADAPTNGAVEVLSQTLIYTPTAQFEGTDSFTYTITDGRGANDAARVTVLVLTETAQVNLVTVDITTETTTTFSGVNPTTNEEDVVTVQTPISATTEGFVLVYIYLPTTTHPLTTDTLRFVGQLFILEAYMDGQLQEPLTFSQPITLTLTYRDADIVGLDELTLEVRFWDEMAQVWSDEGIASTVLTETNRVMATVSHLTEFALFGQPMAVEPNVESVYLPLIRR